MNKSRMVVLGFALVAASSIGIWRWTKRDPLTPVIAAAAELSNRTIEARLCGFNYRARPVRERGAGGADGFRLRASALTVLKRTESSDKPSDLYAAGVAALLTGDASAIDRLRSAAATLPSDARYQNDLAAALHTRALSEADAGELVHALAAADQALRLDPSLTEALFNRAVILETMRLRQHAAVAWETYLRADGISPWAAEARERLTDVRPVLSSEELRTPTAVLEHPTGGDDAIIGPLIARFPEETRRLGEATILARWANAFIQHRDDSEAWLADARAIGKALTERNADHLLASAVDAIDRCGTDACRDEIAEAHRIYDQARQLYAARQVGDAISRFRRASAIFRKHASPMAAVADYYAASCLEDQADPLALPTLERLLSTTPGSYRSLRAQLFWEIGTARSRAGNAVEALDAYRRATELFMNLGEDNNSNRTRSSASAACLRIGLAAEARRLRSTVFASFSAANNSSALQAALELAARMEASEGHWEVATSLFALATEPPFRVNKRVDVSALLWSALAIARLGNPDSALTRIEEARREAWTLEEGPIRTAALDDLTFAEAAVIRQSAPEHAAQLLDRYIDASQRMGRTFLLAEAFLERGRVARDLRQPEEAARFFQQALQRIDESERDAAAARLLEAYFATGSAAATELADLLDSRGRVAEAFAVIEQARGRALAREAMLGRTPANPDEIRVRLDDQTAILSYLLFSDHLLVFTVDRRAGLRHWRFECSAAQIKSEIDQMRSAIDRREDSDANARASTLYRVLIEPLPEDIRSARTWIVVPDPKMEGLPFAALRDGHGRRVVETSAVAYAMSAGTSVSSPGRTASPLTASGQALIVGNPSFDREQFPSFASLTRAEREAAAVGRLYPGATILIGDRATAERFLRELPLSRLIHVGTHAIVSFHDPMRSLLAFAPSADRSGVVYATDIVRAPLSADLVVLAGCQTAAPSEVATDLRSLSRAFLTAGARSVIGTLWNVDDHDAADFSLRLHESLRAGIEPVEAVRRAQLHLLRDRPLREWSAFTLLSTDFTRGVEPRRGQREGGQQ